MSLYVEDSGPGPTHTLVFLHGFPMDHTMWDEQVALAKPRFRTIAYDHRGHGQSEVGNGQYAFERFVDDLFEVLDARQISKAILCGLSMGGYVALRAAERAPERITGLILCDTRSESDTNEARLKRASTVKVIQNKGVPTFCEGFMKAVLAPETFTQKPSLIERIRHLIVKGSPVGMVGAVLAMAGRTDTTAALSTLRVPAIVIGGEKDATVPPAAMEALAKAIPGATLALIPNAGHFSNLENPTAFNRHFQEFLQRIIVL